MPDAVVYRAEAESFSLWGSLRRVAQHREVLLTFSVRYLRIKYRQTLLGVLWAVIPTFMLMVLFSIVFSRFGRMSSEGFPYPIFAYSALLPWTLFNSSLSSAANSVVGNSAIISKVYFPREILPWSAMAGPVVDFAIGAVIFAGMLAFYHIPVSWYALWTIPLLLMVILLAAGLGPVFAAFNVYYRDVRYALPLLMQVWLYATPVAYPAGMIPERYRLAYFIVNPLAGLIDGFRRVLLRELPPDPVAAGASFVSAVLIFAVCYRIFKRLEREFVDVI